MKEDGGNGNEEDAPETDRKELETSPMGPRGPTRCLFQGPGDLMCHASCACRWRLVSEAALAG